MKTIKGSTNPKAEEKTFYELSDFIYHFENPLFGKKENEKHIWTLYKQINNNWKQVSGNIKYGEKVPYTFGEKAVGISFKIEVHTESKNILNKIEKKLTASLVVVPRTKHKPVIGRVILLNRDNADVNKATFNESLSAEARTSNLVGKEITFYLWEEGATEEKKYQKPKTAKVDIYGIAKIKFKLSEYATPQTWMSFFSGNDNTTKKFFVSASYLSKETTNKTPVSVTESQQQQPQQQTEKKDESTGFIEKATNIIAEGIGKIGDYVEEKTRTATSVGNSEIDKSIKSKCFCNRDFEEKDVRQLVKLLKGSETIWEGQALKGGKRAECNIQDKSFATLTKELNSALKKYNINTCAKKMHFLAQVTEETGTFALSEETKSDYLSSQSIYKGRGLLQLTGVRTNPKDSTTRFDNPGPYKDYADYKGDQSILKKPEIVANNVHYCIDSGAWIWSVNKKMPKSPSSAVDRWGDETSGKSLNELAVYVDKYLELISVLLNGRNKNTGMPNGWEKRKSNYNLLKTGFFMYEKYHGKNSKSVTSKDIITYHIFANGEIERHIPKAIKSGYEKKYKYIYHDKNEKEHEICIVDWLEIDKVKRQKPNPTSIPNGYISHEAFNIPGVNQKHVYKYSDGTVIASGEAGEGGGSIKLKFVKSGGKAIIVKIPDPLNYNSENIKINLSFQNTIRKYMGRDHFAALIGALAECGLPLVSEGSAMKDGTCFPSVSHTNGESIDSDYYNVENTQKYINAMANFGITTFYYKPGMRLRKPTNAITFREDSHHRAHLHCGTSRINIKEIKE
ncbi:hypothetical protein [Chryseobacterium sp. 2R14A]|uniref:hypothetical protein n=1 Tax=Chryseobacterium sp. 2R14A TaxID=3380353 RepID=UPI003CF093FD